MSIDIVKTSRSEEDQKRANEIFDSLRDELLKRELSNTENYDKAILTLSAAALGLSLTAIRFIIPLETAEHIWLIKLGWILLLFSIITSICAYLMSNKAISEQLRNAEDYYIKSTPEAFNRPNVFTKVNDWLNYITGIVFVIAISAIVVFVTINISQEEMKMSNSGNGKGSTVVHVKDSASVPTMQQVEPRTVTKKISTTIPTMPQAPSSSSQSSGSGSSSSGSSSSSSGSSD